MRDTADLVLAWLRAYQPTEFVLVLFSVGVTFLVAARVLAWAHRRSVARDLRAGGFTYADPAGARRRDSAALDSLARLSDLERRRARTCPRDDRDAPPAPLRVVRRGDMWDTPRTGRAPVRERLASPGDADESCFVTTSLGARGGVQ